MNKDVRRKFAAVAAAISLAFPAALFAQTAPAETAFESGRESAVGEAGKAVLDRVFGGDEAADVDYFTYDLSNHSRGSAALRSFLVPGWGQIFNGQRVKGLVLFFAFAGAVAGSVTLHDKSNESYSAYRATGLRDGSLYDDYDSERTRSTVLAGVAVALWGFSIFDASRNAYNPLWASRPDGLTLAATPEEAGVVYRRRF